MKVKSAGAVALLVWLLLIPVTAVCEHGAFDIKVLELADNGNNEYSLRFIQLSQPFGYEHKKDRELTVHLRFQCPIYECTEDGDLPTEKDFNAALELLRKQIAESEVIRVEVADRGYAKIAGKKNEYQTNALYIRDDIVHFDFDFFDF